MSGFGKYQEEIEQVDRLIQETNFQGLKSNLEKYRSSLVAKAFQEDKQSAVATAPVSASTSSADENASDAPTAKVSAKPAIVPIVGQFIPITDFLWDQGSYNTPGLSVYIEIPNVGTAKDRVSCIFGRHSIDLTVADVDGKNYRLVNNNLEKDIVPDQCKWIVKKDKIVLKLQKVKGEHSYENWNQLSAKKPRDAAAEAAKKKDPQGSLMDMMKDLYEDGDANMKKVIGEAMSKSKNGEKPAEPSMPSMPSSKGKMGAGLGSKSKLSGGGKTGGGSSLESSSFGGLDDIDDDM